MRLKNTIVWGIILLLLTCFVYYYEVKGGQERKQAEEEAGYIFVFDEQDIRQLELEFDEKLICCIKSETGDWQLVAPVDYSGDKEAIKRLIETINEATIERDLGALDQELSTFGLDNPQLKLKLTSKDKTYTLLLGAKNPLGNFIYAKRADDTQLFLLYASLHDSLKQDVFDLRDKRVISVPEAEVTQIELDYTERKLVLTNDVQTGWQITYPRKLGADPVEVSKLIRQINIMRVKEFAAEKTDNLSSFNLDKPWLKLTVYTGRDKAQRQLLVGHRDVDMQGIYAKLSTQPQIMLLDTSVASDFTKKIFDLRERRILQFDTVRVNELELENPTGRIQLKKENEEWYITKTDDNAPAKGYMVEGMLYDLAHLRASEFIEGEQNKDINYGWDTPQIKVSLKLGYEGNTSDMGLLIGAETKHDKNLVYVKRDDGQVFTVAKDIVEQLSQKPADLMRDIPGDETQ